MRFIFYAGLFVGTAIGSGVVCVLAQYSMTMARVWTLIMVFLAVLLLLPALVGPRRG